jgi:hypothetical protein
MSRGCFTSYRLVWDPGNFTFYGVLLFMGICRRYVGDCLDDAWMIAVDQGCWSIRNFPFDTWRRGVVDSLSVDDHIDFSMMSDFRVGIHWMGMILDSGCDPLRHYILWMMALLEDKKYLGREDLSCPHFWIPLFSSGNDFRGLSVKKKGVKRGN